MSQGKDLGAGVGDVSSRRKRARVRPLTEELREGEEVVTGGTTP